MMQPKISVVIIYSNSADTIKECLNSVLHKSFLDIEIICVNNGSNENSENIVKEIALSYENEK